MTLDLLEPSNLRYQILGNLAETLPASTVSYQLLLGLPALTSSRYFKIRPSLIPGTLKSLRTDHTSCGFAIPFSAAASNMTLICERSLKILFNLQSRLGLGLGSMRDASKDYSNLIGDPLLITCTNIPKEICSSLCLSSALSSVESFRFDNSRSTACPRFRICLTAPSICRSILSTEAVTAEPPPFFCVSPVKSRINSGKRRIPCHISTNRALFLRRLLGLELESFEALEPRLEPCQEL